MAASTQSNFSLDLGFVMPEVEAKLGKQSELVPLD